jgi:ribosomal protein L17
MDRVITLGKRNTLHTRRQAISLLGSTLSAKRAVRKVFGELAGQYASRPGGYTRILRLPAVIRQAKVDRPRGRIKDLSKLYGSRLGDNADMVLWELCGAETAKRTKKERKLDEKADSLSSNSPADTESKTESKPE